MQCSRDSLTRFAGAIGHLVPLIAFTAAVASATTLDVGRRAQGSVDEASKVLIPKDEFSYLEDLSGASPWVTNQNGQTLADLGADRRFEDFYQAALESEEARNSSDGAGLLTPAGDMSLQGRWVYQLWTDSSHQRGVWRRAELDAFIARTPKWQVLLDLDSLSANGEENWILVRAIFSPSGRRCLLQLTLGGARKASWREFDLERRALVKGGFELPSSTDTITWRSEDTVVVATDTPSSENNSQERVPVVKKWRRGTSLDSAAEIFRGRADDKSLQVIDPEWGGSDKSESNERTIHIVRRDSASVTSMWQFGTRGKLVQLPEPISVNSLLYKGNYIVALTDDWSPSGGKFWKKGDVVSIDAAAAAGPRPPTVVRVMTLGEGSTYGGAFAAAGGLFVSDLELGGSRIWRCRYDGGAWVVDLVPLPEHGLIRDGSAEIGSNIAFVRYESFLQPSSLYKLDMERNEAVLFETAPAQFDSSKFLVEQLEAVSVDREKVPYTVIRPRSLKFDGRAPTIIESYGAYEALSLAPQYLGVLGRLWLEQGGVYIFAGIRGGRERGREWAVKGVERQHTYDDLVSVAEDTIRRKVTSSKRIGFMGFSAGGLLGGVMLTQRPDLFAAIVLKAPFLDQFRMDLVTSGAAAFKEFGSPDIPRERAFLQRTSPFQNLRSEADLPVPLILTSRTDENVHPAQPRRFAAKMQSLRKPFFFYETADGGHALAVTPDQRARLEALIYVYFTRQLVDQSSAE